jgi:hypothetical protein
MLHDLSNQKGIKMILMDLNMAELWKYNDLSINIIFQFQKPSLFSHLKLKVNLY